MNIQEAIKENTVINCKTEEEANRILKMAHELGYTWCIDRNYMEDNEWSFYRKNTCYSIYEGAFGDIKYFKNREYNIINSTEITDMKTTTDWTPAPEDLLDMKQELTITPPSGYEIDEEKSTFQKIVFRKIEKKFPTKLKEIDRPWLIGISGNIYKWDGARSTQSPKYFTSKESAEMVLSFKKALAFRDAIWEIEGKPENEKIDITFRFKTTEGAEHFKKMRREIIAGNL